MKPFVPDRNFGLAFEQPSAGERWRYLHQRSRHASAVPAATSGRSIRRLWCDRRIGQLLRTLEQVAVDGSTLRAPGRPDVLVYETEVLTEAVRVQGIPAVAGQRSRHDPPAPTAISS